MVHYRTEEMIFEIVLHSSLMLCCGRLLLECNRKRLRFPERKSIYKMCTQFKNSNLLTRNELGVGTRVVDPEQLCVSL